MKKEIILSVAGVCNKNSTRVRSYCRLIQNVLHAKWLLSDEFIQAHVCMVREDYLKNWDNQKVNSSQVLIVVNASVSNYKYQIDTPITAQKIKIILNEISREETFKPISSSQNNSKTSTNLLKFAISKIRKNFFSHNEKKVLKKKLVESKLFIHQLTKSLKGSQFTPCKVVLLGSPGAGKTTTVKSASANNSLTTEVSATDSVALDKLKTTIGIDYAKVLVKNNYQQREVQLYGTPGQIKFNFVWEVIGKNADAFIILIDMSRPDPESYLKFYLRFLFNEFGKETNIFCALTHYECFSEGNDFLAYLRNKYQQIKYIHVIDSRKKEDIFNLLEQIV